MPRVGVLALQGDFEAHAAALKKAGADPVMVRTAKQLADVAGLILPGGESTTMLKLMHSQGLFEPVKEFAQSRPIFGTCAGLILMANGVTHPAQESLDLIDIEVKRNGYGRQIDSRVARIEAGPVFARQTGEREIEAVFIRAPVITKTAPDVRVHARYEGDPVLIEQGRHFGATFHPELADKSHIHRYFVDKVERTAHQQQGIASP